MNRAVLVEKNTYMVDPPIEGKKLVNIVVKKGAWWDEFSDRVIISDLDGNVLKKIDVAKDIKEALATMDYQIS